MNRVLSSLLNRHIALIAFLISFIISPWIYYPWHVMNKDGIIYLNVAYIANTQGIIAAFNNYDWPSLSIMIGELQKLTHLSYINSAFLIEALLLGLSAFFFVKIIIKLGGEQLTAWQAMIVFLSFETILNYRGDVLRDPGYWAFYLMSFYFLLQFAQMPKISTGLMWFFSTIAAILFRVEGIPLLLLSPFAVFFFKHYSFADKLKAWIKLYLPLFILAICAVLAMLFYWTHAKQILLASWHQVAMLFYVHGGNISVFDKFQLAATHFHDLVLPKVAKLDSATTILFIGLIGYFICKIIGNVGILNFILVLSSWVKKQVPFKENQQVIMIWLILISLLIPLNFLLGNQFISTRYLVSTSIILLLFVPFTLSYCITHPTLPIKHLFTSKKYDIQNNTRSIFSLKALFILYMLVVAGHLGFLWWHAYYKNTSSVSVRANMWLYENRAQLANVCSTDSWPLFAVTGEQIAFDKVDSSLLTLLNDSEKCQYIVFVGSPTRLARLQLLQYSPNWHLYKMFQAHNSKRNIYIFSR
ncbi:MAG: hypothetical protein ACK4PR_05940 [Gammaproteobacteria bacterium]